MVYTVRLTPDVTTRKRPQISPPPAFWHLAHPGGFPLQMKRRIWDSSLLYTPLCIIHMYATNHLNQVWWSTPLFK